MGNSFLAKKLFFKLIVILADNSNNGKESKSPLPFVAQEENAECVWIDQWFNPTVSNIVDTRTQQFELKMNIY